MDFPHMTVCFCYRSSFTTGPRPYHLTFSSSCFVNPGSVAVMAINRILLFSGLSELWPKRGKLNGETPPPPSSVLSHMQMFTLSCLLCLGVTSSLFVMQQNRWCRAPVSFRLSRCFTWETYQNIDENPNFYHMKGMSGHVWGNTECASTQGRCLLAASYCVDTQNLLLSFCVS